LVQALLSLRAGKSPRYLARYADNLGEQITD
jgi:hypothetical protein